MYSLDVFEKSIANMDDHQLIQRWKDGLFSDETKPIAEKELSIRGIDPTNPVARPSTFEADATPQPFKPRLLPVLFAALGGATAGREIGAALAGYIGAGVMAFFVAVLGWFVGGYVARFAHKQKHLVVRILIGAASLIAWLYLSGVGVVVARLMRGTLVR